MFDSRHLHPEVFADCEDDLRTRSEAHPVPGRASLRVRRLAAEQKPAPAAVRTGLAHRGHAGNDETTRLTPAEPERLEEFVIHVAIMPERS